jgi:hypothetical protein
MDLPSVIPLFPLPNVVLFPGVPLPLHIFEPRYREMVEQTKDADGIIGMILLRGDWHQRYYGNPEIFSVGCAGRMVSVESLDDGRFNILLHGTREFVIERELQTRSYRMAQVRWGAASPPDIGLPPIVRQTVVNRLREYATLHLEDAPRKLLDDATLGDELLVNFFCYALDLAPLEKQGLLEAGNLLSRAHRLVEALEFHLHEARLGNPSFPLRGTGQSH